MTPLMRLTLYYTITTRFRLLANRKTGAKVKKFGEMRQEFFSQCILPHPKQKISFKLHLINRLQMICQFGLLENSVIQKDLKPLFLLRV